MSASAQHRLEQKGYRMPQVTYVSASGVSRKIDVPAGMSVMQAALNNRVEGILGECGGNCMCATCHVYVDAAFLDRIPAAKENEKFMLSIAAEGPQTNSRLSCQIKMSEELDGLTIRIPARQK
jgi:2Fe-2S ferredoxin